MEAGVGDEDGRFLKEEGVNCKWDGHESVLLSSRAQVEDYCGRLV